MPEADKKKPVRYDVDGFEAVTEAIQTLLNQYPGLEGLQIQFSTLEKDGGIAWIPITGAAIDTEKKYITGKVYQLCNYPFYVVYRTGTSMPARKITVKEFLDSLGRWLERQPVKIGEETLLLTEYPNLSGGRKITSISRQTSGYLDTIEQDGVENWVIYLALKYTNEFYL